MLVYKKHPEVLEKASVSEQVSQHWPQLLEFHVSHYFLGRIAKDNDF